ncbi:RHS repeat-associated core domain-containing protein [Chryseobacterium oryctis]|uniref:RHS repeat-associated core domain-containing protein n=1 Tax=Chryseobacterium oryctis TaxID=2952618 RepID=A0ABT3HLB4_9FLAO|nr:RHS repeat-associated core domain-containing protein [Chryseobacterium oryctis]MCW3160453.1 RHS repeat-associated core domain-containing protein [Chryseobacterium oryctis]
MKKILIPLGALLFSGMAEAQLSPTENYVYSKTYLDYNGTTPTKTSETVQYFDGLGRPKQVVNVKASPTGKDVVTHIEYDQFGRQVKDYLPIPQSGTLNGAIVPNPLGNASSVYGGEKIFAEKVLENSPLDRIQQQIQVGNDWTNKPVKFDYDANITEDYVRKYETSTTWVEGRTETSVQLLQYFSPNQLYKNTVTDEDGNKTIEFKNGKGQVLLVRKVLNSTENADTYYVYNEYDQLAFVIPPLASAPSVEASTVENLYYQYRYDGKNRLVEKKLPGKGWEYMVYDKADRLILTQDANLEVQGKWLMTKYDTFGRVVYTSIISGGSRTNMQSQAGNLVIVESRHNSGFTQDGMQVQYTNNYFSSLEKILTVNYYDTYPSYGFNPTFPTTIQGQTVLTESVDAQGLSTKSLPVMSLVKNIEDDNWTKNYSYYDTKGRVIGTHSINHLGGYTKTESQLDFSGLAKQTKTYHKRLNTDTERIITETFSYDNQNRLLVHKHQVDSNPEEILAQNEYNELSQLKNKKVGGTNTASPLQSIDYQYNIRGWMTKINDPSNLNGKLFGYEMRYNNPVSGLYPGKFNGNISEIDWKAATDGQRRRYNYLYDSLNRLQHAIYLKPDASVVVTSAYNEWVQYDLNGNITRLDRYGGIDGNGPIQIDQLYYTYSGNRLNSVTDASQNYQGYPDTSGITIPYDSNGNMISHEDKGILQIDYNHLNLPKYIKFNDYIDRKGGKQYVNTTYNYRADGTKITKNYTYRDWIIVNSLRTKTIEYLEGFQYESSSGGSGSFSAMLQFVPTSEGYFDFVKNKYIYNYVDHLGNVRLSYLNNGNGAEVLEENNYYPFGLKHEGYNALAGNSSYQHKYNGKELQETGMYDYGARFYMPDLGRWGVVDPLAEKYRRHSTYTYAVNNPIRFIDPDGRQVMDPIYGKAGTFSNRLKLIGDDGKNTGAAYIVTGSVRKNVEAATKKGETYKGDLSESSNVVRIPTGNRLGAVVQSVEETRKSGRENGGFAYKGDEKVIRSDQGPAAKQKMENGKVVTEASMNPFRVGRQNVRPDNLSNLEILWHTHPNVTLNELSQLPVDLGFSTPSDADKSFQRGLQEDGYTGNSFVIGTKTNDVTYYNSRSTIVTVNYNDLVVAGVATTVNYVMSLIK